MKKIFIFSVISLIIMSCDPLFHDDFIIKNNCDEKIHVSITFSQENNSDTSFIVNAHEECDFFCREWWGSVSRIEQINYLFKDIVVIKKDSLSKINYVNYEIWYKENIESSRRHAYYTNTKYYLTINPEDFEVNSFFAVL